MFYPMIVVVHEVISGFPVKLDIGAEEVDMSGKSLKC